MDNITLARITAQYITNMKKDKADLLVMLEKHQDKMSKEDKDKLKAIKERKHGR